MDRSGETMQIDIEGKQINVNVQYGKRDKLSLHMDSIGFITVKAPKDTTDDVVVGIVKQQSKWLLDRLNRIEAAKKISKIKEYQKEEQFLYLGKTYLLNELIETENLDSEQLKMNLKKFYVIAAKKVITDRIMRYQQQLRVKPKSVEIVESSTKWGSCSSDKKLTFNYRLAMAPVEVIDYVVVHELCHLNHMNHDRSFWRLVGSVLPDYKKKEEFLARYGQYMTL